VNGQREPVTLMAVPCPQDGCGGSAEVIDRFSLWLTDGDILHVKIRCGVGHWFTLPIGPEPIQGDRVRVRSSPGAHAARAGGSALRARQLGA
jgi:hypothetical protein